MAVRFGLRLDWVLTDLLLGLGDMHPLFFFSSRRRHTRFKCDWSSDVYSSDLEWLLDQQVRGPGDWCRNNPGVTPAGWAFEFRNDFYPDLDDTAFVLIALRKVSYPDRRRMDQEIGRASCRERV